MTIDFKNAYIKSAASVCGLEEEKGTFKGLYDKVYNDYYMGEKTFEQAEIKMVKDASEIAIKKANVIVNDIDIVLASDLLNQITISSYSSLLFNRPYFGIYTACASMCEGLIMASIMLDTNKFNNILLNISSHNLTAERQYRNPVEYGCPKPKRSTYTVTGAASYIITNEKTNIKITSGTIGTTTDMNITDTFDMGSCMAASCARTIFEHLKNTNTKVNDYDLILSGDLGIYGSKILKEYLDKKYNVKLGDNYKDSGSIIYNLEKQKYTNAGGSGPACIALVLNTYVMNLIKKKNLKKILVIATGALMSPTMNNQKLSMPSISHAICLEVV